jgi:hypothetical protein
MKSVTRTVTDKAINTASVTIAAEILGLVYFKMRWCSGRRTTAIEAPRSTMSITDQKITNEIRVSTIMRTNGNRSVRFDFMDEYVLCGARN